MLPVGDWQRFVRSAWASDALRQSAATLTSQVSGDTATNETGAHSAV